MDLKLHNTIYGLIPVYDEDYDEKLKLKLWGNLHRQDKVNPEFGVSPEIFCNAPVCMGFAK